MGAHPHHLHKRPALAVPSLTRGDVEIVPPTGDALWLGSSLHKMGGREGGVADPEGQGPHGNRGWQRAQGALWVRSWCQSANTCSLLPAGG